ncbi:hemolysin family protein [Mesorhizobium xinjiangense]|uniref:hemolysin family protein n=1 Tax=Mesorhizobium xinjiangense TaxID=2678685 RepID=UPI0012EE471B|nr:hemolysin family protein [Mesorhizobium xinjiangense]
MLELFIAAGLILLNGVFALSELSVVSSRLPRLKLMAEQHRAGAKAALQLAQDPGRFLSTVQIGITLVAILAGAFSGAALGGRLGLLLAELGLSPRTAGIAGYALVIGAITFFSVVIGELVPKHLALRNPERFACALAPAMLFLSRAAIPVVWLLDTTTKGLLVLLGMGGRGRDAPTDEDIRAMIAEAENAGVIETAEQTMIAGVMRLGDRGVRALMTPRTEVEMLDVGLSEAALRKALIATSHSRIPVYEGDPDAMIGVVIVRDLLKPLLSKRKFDLKKHAVQAPVVPDTVDALSALDALQRANVPVALVHDEFGHFEGLITPADVLDAIAGAFRSDEVGSGSQATQRQDGSWLISGWMPADEMADLIHIRLQRRRSYDTVAGFIIDLLKRIPEVGDTVEAEGWRFEVVDLDGRRIDKVLASRLG